MHPILMMYFNGHVLLLNSIILARVTMYVFSARAKYFWNWQLLLRHCVYLCPSIWGISVALMRLTILVLIIVHFGLVGFMIVFCFSFGFS